MLAPITDEPEEERKTISIHVDTYSQLRKLCAYKEMQTGEKWSMAMILDELLDSYPVQEVELDREMFTTRKPKK